MSMSLERQGEEDAADPAAPSYPPFYRQTPYGFEGPEIEAFTSYVTRLADRHSMPATVLLRHARHCHAEGAGGTNERPPNGMHHSLNGYGPKAQDFARALAAATGIADLIRLTLIPWEGAFARHGQGLLGKDLTWCPHCWSDDLTQGHTPYVRLYWLLKCVSRCRKHETPLRDTCPACRGRQRILPAIPRFQICGVCGTDMLAQFEASEFEDRIASAAGLGVTDGGGASYPTATLESINRQNWYARNVADLIGHTCAAGNGLKKRAAAKAIAEICDSGCGGDTRALIQMTNKDKNAVFAWRSGRYCPQFQVFAELSYRLQVPLSSLLTGDDKGLAFSETPMSTPMPRFTNRRLDTPEARARLAKRIIELEKDPEPPHSLSELARRAGTSTATIRYRFPEEARAVLTKGKMRREADWAVDAERRKRQVASACEQLIEEGEYPTAKRISARFGLVRSEFRKPHIQAVLEAYQSSVSEV